MKRILLSILVIGILLVSACGAPSPPRPFPPPAEETAPEAEAPPPEQPTPSPKYSPANVNLFASATEGEVVRFYFLLEDANGRNTPADGLVRIEIFDDLNNSLYSKEFNVTASEFVDYQFQLTGQYMGKAYEWRVPVTGIEKGISSIGWGRAVLTFVTLDGKELYAEDKTIQIPTYTDEELEQMAEEEYEKSAKSVLLVVEDDDFEVKLLKFGFFTDYSSLGETETLLRSDLVVTCKKAGYFSSYDAKLIDSGGKQYEVSYKSEFEGGELEESVTRTGYIVFENVPENVDISKITIEDYVFDLKSNRGYTYGQFAEEEYEKASVFVNQKISKGSFEVTVTKAGFFSPYEWGEKKQYLRVDMEVKNTGSESEYFLGYGMVILDNQGNQYEQTYGGTLDSSSDIYPGVTKKGSILFEDVPETLSSLRLVFESGYDENFDPYVFEYNIQLK